MHHLQCRSSVRFMLTSLVSSGLNWSSSCVRSRLAERDHWRSFFAPDSGREALSIDSVPSCLQRISTHWPTNSRSIRSVTPGSKHVASRTPELRARTAQCERMSGAEAASRTSTACTPTGTSSSPLTAPLRSTVGVSKILSCMWRILSTTWISPCTGRSTAEIICHGGSCATLRNCGSSRLSTRLTEKRALPRSTSSTNTSRTCCGTPTALPRWHAFSPRRVWKASTCSPTTRERRSHMAFSNSALSTALPLYRRAAHSPESCIQSTSTARSSACKGMCPRIDISNACICSQRVVKRFSELVAWIRTVCCVSSE
mmetsp:Transcript_124569/g.346863  ORF Transcript_124569/g.346863 Transcript_124569/m.346863 type:complete len:314 (+) Transcript_124569:1126-2067(+)